jgi:phytoene dehydrogenase-like protein
VLLNSHVKEIVIEDGRAVGVRLRRGNKVIRAKRAVISNASIWDTTKLLPEGTLPKEKSEVSTYNLYTVRKHVCNVGNK